MSDHMRRSERYSSRVLYLVSTTLSPLVLVLGGCGDSPAEPAAGLEGDWLYSMMTEPLSSTPSLGDAECQIHEASLALSANDRTFVGTIDGTINCAVIGEEVEVFFDNQVTNGLLEGDQVQFDVGTWMHAGTLQDDAMTGEVTIDIRLDGETVDLHGEWSAAR